VMFTIHLHLVPRLTMSGATPLLSQMPSWCEDGQLHLFLWCQWYIQQGLIPNYRISRSVRRTVIFSLGSLEKNNDECILVLVIYWKKTGLLHTKISNHNTIYSSQKPRKSSSLPLKSSSWLFSLSHNKDVV
jgi:hypothetical protein